MFVSSQTVYKIKKKTNQLFHTTFPSCFYVCFIVNAYWKIKMNFFNVSAAFVSSFHSIKVKVFWKYKKKCSLKKIFLYVEEHQLFNTIFFFFHKWIESYFVCSNISLSYENYRHFTLLQQASGKRTGDLRITRPTHCHPTQTHWIKSIW